MVLPRPLWGMKLWFARALRPGQGERTWEVSKAVQGNIRARGGSDYHRRSQEA
jgi:hypothetical protein